MTLVHESTLKQFGGYNIGDMKYVGYSISFTANAVTEPMLDYGWYLLNGAILSQNTFPVLYSNFGSAFNTGGEGVGNFRLPDFTDGKLPLPKGLVNFTDYGDTGGEITHELAFGEMTSHTHPDNLSAVAAAHSHPMSASNTSSAGGAHTHTYTRLTTAAVGGTSSSGIEEFLPISTTGSVSTAATSHSHAVSVTVANDTSANITDSDMSGSISEVGSSTGHNNLQPYVVMGGWLVRYR